MAQYEELTRQFHAENFDADFITDMALNAEMKYINLNTCHHDLFCLFDRKYTNFNSINSPSKRDLAAELADHQKKKELGFASIICTAEIGDIHMHPTITVGAEDFIATELKWKKKTDKPIEICDTHQPHQWFYNKAFDGKHKSSD